VTIARALARRTVEATTGQLVATGAVGNYGVDPVDGDVGFKPLGSIGRQMPPWTTEKARASSVAAYRANPMGRAIVDTYTSFIVGDKGVSYQVTNPQVREVVDQFWSDPRNNVGGIQELLLRDQILNGESALEMLEGAVSGVVRFAPMNVTAIQRVSWLNGNPLWPDELLVAGQDGEYRPYKVVQVDDATGLRAGQAQFWTPWKTLVTDQHSMPFLTPILDWLDNYDQILSNLIDRTALARYLVWDVTVKGDQTAVNAFVDARGGLHPPPSGSVEVHNENVTWEQKSAPSGAFEDAAAAGSALTLIAGGSGLAKHWLAEPEHTNRATGQTMAEPVRRRVQGVQKMWLGYQTELVRFVVDRAVAAKRLPEMVTAADPRTGQSYQIRAAQCVTVTGPEIAAADAEITAQVLLNLSTGLENLSSIGALSPEATRIAARKAWEDFVGVPYTADLDSPDANRDDIATAIDTTPKSRRLQPVAGTQGA
jgi:hypothetical protein